MNNEELQGLRNTMNEASHEIRGLRRVNEILRAKVEVLELFAPLVLSNPAFQRLQMASPDVVHALANACKAIDEAEQKATTKAE